ncbi:MAG: serine/threonine protein kinase [Phycisphaeraceae bacterium]|nr:serine/threonine protein kinase [Phycisphaeraceae bacterium]
MRSLPPLAESIGPIGSSDSELAATIFKDGRNRRVLGEDLTLSDYLRIVPNLRSRELVLDAVIGVCIGRQGVSDSERLRRAEQERRKHPELAGAIELSLCLDHLVGPSDARPLTESGEVEGPESLRVGPSLEDGDPRYFARRIIGQGAGSTVYEAEDRLLSADARPSRVAIKLFQPDSDDPTLFERTIAEARKARSIDHPGVVRVLDAGRRGSSMFIVLEFVRGETLDVWLAHAGRNAGHRRMIALMRDIASAVAAIHAAGLVHRDLKPANVVVGESGEIKIVDFGASRPRLDHAKRQEVPDRLGGTLAFMSPEQFRLDPDADAPMSDIYSLGAMLYWAFVGASPHGGSTISAMAALAGGELEASPEESLRRAGVCPQIQRIILRAIALRPGDRYKSADLLAADLESWLRHRPIDWQRPGPMGRARLLVLRHPVVVSLVLLCGALSLAGGIGWINAARAGAAARASEQAAQIEHAKVEATQEWKKRAADQLTRMLMGFSAAKNNGLEAEVLTSLWVLEWVHGPMLLETPDLLDKVWKSRIDVLERARDRLRASGNADSVTAQLMIPSLAMWYMRSGQASQAERILATSEEFWRTRIDDSDPWLRDLRAMASAARLARCMTDVDADGSALARVERRALSDEVVRVKAWAATYAAAKITGPIPSLIQETLAKANDRLAPR